MFIIDRVVKRIYIAEAKKNLKTVNADITGLEMLNSVYPGKYVAQLNDLKARQAGLQNFVDNYDSLFTV